MEIKAKITTPNYSTHDALEVTINQSINNPVNTAVCRLGLATTRYQANLYRQLKNALGPSTPVTITLTTTQRGVSHRLVFKGMVQHAAFYAEYVVVSCINPLAHTLLGQKVNSVYHKVTLQAALSPLLPPNTQWGLMPRVLLHNYVATNQTALQLLTQLQNAFGIVVYQTTDATTTTAESPFATTQANTQVPSMAYAQNLIATHAFQPGRPAAYGLAFAYTDAYGQQKQTNTNNAHALTPWPLPVAQPAEQDLDLIAQNLHYYLFDAHTQGQVTIANPPFWQAGQLANLEPKPGSGLQKIRCGVGSVTTHFDPNKGLYQTIKTTNL